MFLQNFTVTVVIVVSIIIVHPAWSQNFPYSTGNYHSYHGTEFPITVSYYSQHTTWHNMKPFYHHHTGQTVLAGNPVVRVLSSSYYYPILISD